MKPTTTMPGGFRPLAMALALAGAFTAGIARADIVSLGDVFPDPSAPGACGGPTIHCTLFGGPLQIGRRFDASFANGGVTINGGSVLSSSMGFFAGANNGNGSNGTLTITGAGSQLLIPVGPGNFNIGFGPADTGSVVVESGGRLTTSGGTTAPSDIGAQEGSTGSLTIRTGGQFDFAGPWIVLGGGLSGGIPGATTSGSLIVEQGGIANVTGFIGTGNFSGSNANIRVSGSGSVLRIDPAGGGQALTIGSFGGIGNANVLVETGGLLQTVDGPLSLGALPGYQHVVTVRDAGSRIDLGSGQLNVWGNGGLTTVSVLDGGTLKAGWGSISNGTLLVSGTGSTLDLAPSATLTLGVGGKLGVQNGAQAFVGSPTPGPPIPSFPGSTSLLGVGLSGAGTLLVQGGTVEGSFTSVGSAGTVNVTNGGQVTMTHAFHLGMGAPGTAALTITSGGQVTAPSILIGSAGGSATVSVSGPGSRLDALGATPAIWPGLYLGGGIGSVGSLTLQGGAQSAALNVGVGFAQGSTGTINVQGGSLLESLGGIGVGVNGQGSMTLSSGSAAKAQNAFIGQAIGATGTLTVGGGSLLSLVTTNPSPSTPLASLIVGREGTGTLNVNGGGRVLIDAIPQGTTRFGNLQAGGAGVTPPATIAPTGNGTINVSGSGSEIRFVQHAGGVTQYYATTIGRQGTGALNITNGGHVINENMDAAFSIVGRTPTGVGTVLVSGGGSRWEAGKRLFIATDVNGDAGSPGFMTPIGNGGTGTVTVSNGGVIKVADYVYVATGGTLKGNGTVDGDITLAGGSVKPGTSPGTLTITGDFTMDSGVLEIEVGGLGTGQFDVLDIGGSATLNGGIIRFSFIDGFLPQMGNAFDFLLANGLALGQVGYEYAGAPPGFLFAVNPIGNALRFVALNDAGAVPEPATIALILLALSGLLVTRRPSRVACRGR